MIGECDNSEGDVCVNGRVFYVSQTPWLFPASIKQNITFGSEYEKDKFEKIIEVCALKSDLDSFPEREMTQIGENGMNLSGGQRSRICL